MGGNFWEKLKKPIFVLAPMANVTDAAFRRMFVEAGGERGKPSVFWTEFVSVEGLLSAGREKLLVDFWFVEGEHPIVAQIFGGKPEQYEEVASLIVSLGFDGVDINMGCPDSGVEKSGGGAALIKDPARAKEIIRALKRGLQKAAPAGAGPLPVSVKTRAGYRSLDEMEPWITALLEEDITALTVHLRTRAEMSAVSAHWEIAPKIKMLRDKIAPQTILLGNGDVDSLATAHARIAESGFDGVMIGRGIFGNPWFFSGHVPSICERLERLVVHAELFEKLYRSDKQAFSHGELTRGDERNGKDRIKNFEVMKKHFKAYCSGFDDAKDIRVKLMETESAADVRRVIEDFLKEQK